MKEPTKNWRWWFFVCHIFSENRGYIPKITEQLNIFENRWLGEINIPGLITWWYLSLALRTAQHGFKPGWVQNFLFCCENGSTPPKTQNCERIIRVWRRCLVLGHNSAKNFQTAHSCSTCFSGDLIALLICYVLRSPPWVLNTFHCCQPGKGDDWRWSWHQQQGQHSSCALVCGPVACFQCLRLLSRPKVRPLYPPVQELAHTTPVFKDFRFTSETIMQWKEKLAAIPVCRVQGLGSP
jgi:hypothetical protein